MTATASPGRYVHETPARYLYEVWSADGTISIRVRGHLLEDLACQHADEIGGYVTRIELLYDARPTAPERPTQ